MYHPMILYWEIFSISSNAELAIGTDLTVGSVLLSHSSLNDDTTFCSVHRSNINSHTLPEFKQTRSKMLANI